MDHFITLAASKFVPAAKFQEIEAVADELEQHLTLRTYAVGYRLTAADFALWGAMKRKPFSFSSLLAARSTLIVGLTRLLEPCSQFGNLWCLEEESASAPDQMEQLHGIIGMDPSCSY